MAKKIAALFSALLIVSFFFPLPFSRAETGAGFVFSPSTGSFIAGKTFATTVFVDTKGNSINAAEGTISFPRDLLQVESISKTDSIFKFWVQDPTFSNDAGTISFSGGLPTPGFSGSNGALFSITFKTMGAGVAKVNLSSGSILANDGMGTNILAFHNDPTYSIGARVEGSSEVASTQEKVPQTFGAPSAPSLFSRTHSDEHSWYSSKTVEVSWNLPSDVTGVNYALAKNAYYQLGTTSKGIVNRVTYDVRSYDGGRWYFYVRLRNANGWGAVASRQILIDFKPPRRFTITRMDTGDATNPNPVLSFDTTDAISPISHYMIQIDGVTPIEAASIKQGDVYVLPAQLPGDHLISVQAYDSANNVTESLLKITVTPLDNPEVFSYSVDASPPQRPVVVSGSVRSRKSLFEKIILVLRRGSESTSFEAPINADGTWTGSYQGRLAAGEYSLGAYLVDARGARSSEVDGMRIHLGNWLSDTLTSIGEFSVVGVGIILGLALIVGLAIYFYTRLLAMRKRFFSDIQKFEEKIDSDLHDIKEDFRYGRTRKATRLESDIKKMEQDLKQDAENLKDLNGK